MASVLKARLVQEVLKRKRLPRCRVAITGVGIVSPLGLGWRLNAEGFRLGRVALGPISLFDTSRQRTSLGGEVKLPTEIPRGRLSKNQARRVHRASALLLLAGFEAIRQAGWRDERFPSVPLVFGTSAGAMSLGEAYYRQFNDQADQRHGQATRADGYQPQRQVMHLADALGLEGPITIISNACASGANAIGQAFRLIQSGQYERVLCGGYDALCQLVFAGFDSLQALSPSIPRPFDAARDGLALGEGAAALVLESWNHAEGRGTEIIAEMRGYGISTDVHHLTQPHPKGDAAHASMSLATKDAGLRADDIDYINAHGTGTPLNDSAEALAIQRWGSQRASQVAVSSTKGGIGHLLGGAGAVEAALCCMALREQWIPPCVNVREPDPECRFDLVTEPRDAVLRNVMSNSFGFGGANASVILGAA